MRIKPGLCEFLRLYKEAFPTPSLFYHSFLDILRVWAEECVVLVELHAPGRYPLSSMMPEWLRKLRHGLSKG